MKSNKVAVAVGYHFGIVPREEVADISMKMNGVVLFEGEKWNLMKASSYEDSRKIDQLLDKYGEYAIKDYKIEPVIMFGTVEMVVPGFDKERDSLMFGAYEVTTEGKTVPFDFSGMGWNIEQDGDKITVNFQSGRNWMNTDNYLWDDDGDYAERYKEEGLCIQDITADFLSKATSIDEFMISLEMEREGKWMEYDPEGIAALGGFAIKELYFDNGKEDFAVRQDVLNSYNESIQPLDRFIEKVVMDSSLSEMEKIKKIALKQLNVQWRGNQDFVSIESKDGVSVVYPWMDSTGRFEVEPVEEYGEEAFVKFCDEMKQKMEEILCKKNSLEKRIEKAKTKEIVKKNSDNNIRKENLIE